MYTAEVQVNLVVAQETRSFEISGFQRTIETMQGIVTGIMPNQTVDVEVASNQNEILIFQSEILKAYPGIAAIRKVLHDAVGEDETNRHLASLANVDFVPKVKLNLKRETLSTRPIIMTMVARPQFPILFLEFVPFAMITCQEKRTMFQSALTVLMNPAF